MKHEDERRIIYDWVNDEVKQVKIVYVKDEISIGDHYHLKKDERFFLAHGRFKELQLGEEILYDLSAPYIVEVPAGTYHRFICEIGSILIGVATKEFDESDEIKPQKSIINEHY